ncbi:MAG TPA: methionine--tRNA ligase [Polyangia bacterium]|nr:methionine--tRNA ligase [Polyangia bacterium]
MGSTRYVLRFMSRLYFTTPIYYVSDPPHLGHAYTTIIGDVFARYHRQRGDDTRYLTGTDEHGQKIERIAAARGRTPKAHADEVAETYRAAWERLNIRYDEFIRTTDPDHEETVVELWRRMEERGDIYLGHYEGWYCVACEQYYTEKELAPGNLCTVHQKPVEKVKEESYFFRLSAYQARLQEFYDRVQRETGRPFIEPMIRMNEVRAFVDAGLEDFSVSRTTFQWGIPVPGRPRHVVYVWIDALTNYYSATRRPRLHGAWDEDVTIVHLMGKEITRFHAVYWPAMLMSAGIRPPSKILAHGWWTVDGEKMSKTRGNVVDPLRLAEDLGTPDAFRYFVLREVPLGADGDFSHQALIQRYNAELANDLGNLVNRTLGMVTKYLGSTVSPAATGELREAAERAVAEYAAEMANYAPSRALDAVWKLVRAGNEYIERSAPWKQDQARQGEVLWNALETCRVLSQLIDPFMPERAAELRRQIGAVAAPEGEREALGWQPGRSYTVAPGKPLFPRIGDDRRQELLARWAPAQPAAAPEPGAAAQRGAAPSAGAAPADKPPVSYEDFAKLDLRVARIVAAERVPKKDRLLKLQVDVGGTPRTVVAGIAAAYAPEQLVGRQVIFLANLKPAKIGGIVSEGMLLAAGDPDVLALSALDRDVPSGTKIK